MKKFFSLIAICAAVIGANAQPVPVPPAAGIATNNGTGTSTTITSGTLITPTIIAGGGTASFTGTQKFIGTRSDASVATLNIARFQPDLLAATKMFWLDPSRLSGTDGDQVATFPDIMASGTTDYSFTSTGGYRPLLYNTAINGRPGLRFSGTQFLASPSTLLDSSFNTSFSIAVVVQMGRSWSRLIDNTVSGTTRFQVDASSNFLLTRINNNSNSTTCALGNSQTGSGVSYDYPMVFVSTYDGVTLKNFINGVQVATATASPSLAMSGSLTIGTSTFIGSGVYGYVGDVIGSNAVWNTNTVYAISDYLAVKYGLNKSKVFAIGDSLTAGVGITTNNYVNELALLAKSDPWLPVNMGVTSLTTANITSNAWLGNLTKTDKSNVIMYWAGINDAGTGVASGTTYANAFAYCTEHRSQGYKVVIATLLPSGTSAATDTARLGFSGSVRANWATFADALLDFAADPVMGESGDQTNTTYYQSDKIHITSVGYQYLAPLAYSALRRAVYGTDSIRNNAVASVTTSGTTFLTPASAGTIVISGTESPVIWLPWAQGNNGLAFTFQNAGTGTASIVTSGSGDSIYGWSGTSSSISLTPNTGTRLRYSGSIISQEDQRNPIVVSGTLVSGTASIVNAAFNGGTIVSIVDTGTSVTNLSSIQASLSGSTATVQSSALYSTTFNLTVKPQ